MAIFLPTVYSIHLPLMLFLPCLNLLNLLTIRQDFMLKVFENKVVDGPEDMDSYKMAGIESDFRLYSC